MRSFRSVVALAALTVVALPASSAADGEDLIVLERSGKIFVVRSDGSGSTELGPGSAPAWSPDGTRVAYVSGGDIWVLALASGVRTRITSTAVGERGPIWSPDGTRVAFSSTPSAGDPSGLDVAAADGASVVRVATDVRAAYGPPSWSPDGAELAYTAVRGYTDDLAVARADGSGVRRLTADDVRDVAPVWAPRGDTIAFFRAGGPEGVTPHLVDADGSGLRQLSKTTASVPLERGAVAWSPDGRRIAFNDLRVLGYGRYGPYYASDMRVLDLDGGERALLSGGERPFWSADGNRIVFHSSRQAPGEETGIQTYVMNADGSCQSRVAAGTLGAQPWHGAFGPPLRCVDLQLSLTQDRLEVGIDQAATFVLTVTNAGTEPATGSRLEVDEPANGVLSLSSAAGPCSIGPGGSCSLGTLAPGGAAKVTAVVQARGVGPVMASVRVRANEPDRNQAGNHASLRFDSLPCSLVGTYGDDVVTGTHGLDVICTRTGRDLIRALAGADDIDSGNGSDRVFPGPGSDTVNLKGGADFVDARDGRRDAIACGSEIDIALVDRLDSFDRACEVASTTTLRCTTLGTSRADTLAGSSRRDSICVFSGNDSVAGGPGGDEIDGGTGNDTLTGGPGGDLVLGGGGNDLIKVRDGDRDVVRCGSELDLVFADRHDIADGDCERVRRR